MSIIINPPKEYLQPVLIATNFDISVERVILGIKAIISVRLKDESDICFKIETLELEGDEYKFWGSDDNYIVEWVKIKLVL